MGSVCTVDILRALSDDKSLTLFNMTRFTLPEDTDVILTRLGLTRKQYLRMNQLKDAGLVIRKNGKHLLTSLDKVVYESHIPNLFLALICYCHQFPPPFLSLIFVLLAVLYNMIE